MINCFKKFTYGIEINKILSKLKYLIIDIRVYGKEISKI